MKHCLLAIGFLMACHICFAQSNKPNNKIITGTQMVYLNYQGQKDSLFMPLVSDQYPALKEALSDKNLFNGDRIEDIKAKYSSCGCGITGLSYEVSYASDNVISIMFYYDVMAMHREGYQEWLTLDVHTGKPYSLANEVTDQGTDYIAVLYKKKLKKNIEADKEAKIDDDVENDVYDDLINTLNGLTTKVIISSYVFTPKGILFKTDDVLPREVNDHEPDRTMLLPYSQLKAYIKPGAIVLKK
jgi:hypothetical protein